MSHILLLALQPPRIRGITFSLARGAKPMGGSARLKPSHPTIFPAPSSLCFAGLLAHRFAQNSWPLRSSAVAAALTGSACLCAAHHGCAIARENGLPRSNNGDYNASNRSCDEAEGRQLSGAAQDAFVPRAHRYPAQSDEEQRHATGLSRLSARLGNRRGMDSHAARHPARITFR